MKNEELDQMIDKSFRTEFDFQLPVDFAQKVTVQIVRREQWKTDLREYLYILGVSFSLLVIVLGFYYFVDKEFILQTFTFLSGNMIPVISIVFILNFIFFADKVLLRLLFSRWSKT
jgi:hypothetical protein